MAISDQCMKNVPDAIKQLPHPSFFDDTVDGVVNSDTVMGFSVGKTLKIFMLYIQYIQHTKTRSFLFRQIELVCVIAACLNIFLFSGDL